MRVLPSWRCTKWQESDAGQLNNDIARSAPMPLIPTYSLVPDRSYHDNPLLSKAQEIYHNEKHVIFIVTYLNILLTFELFLNYTVFNNNHK